MLKSMIIPPESGWTVTYREMTCHNGDYMGLAAQHLAKDDKGRSASETSNAKF